MIRPASIVRFERLYLAGLALGIINIVLNWSATAHAIAAQPALTSVAGWYQPAATLVGVAIPLLLWYTIARRGSRVAKWILTVWTALAVFGLLGGLATGHMVDGIVGVLGVVTILLDVVAVWTLFRPDTRAWFGETVVSDTLP